jgi:rod shape determining protein RodA
MTRLFLPAGILVGVGLLTLSSIAPQLFAAQALWVLLGVLLIALFSFVDWRAVVNHEWIVLGFYGATFVLLVVVLVLPPLVRNVKSWIALGPVSFQPVELAKLALILVYARYFSRRYLSIARWKTMAVSCLYFLAPAILVALQPDLGSVLVLFGIWFGFLLSIGMPLRRLLALLLLLGVGGTLLWQFGMAPYQKERILGVVYPERDALGINYSVIQSKIAIGSAGFWGKGYGQGSQAHLGFLPEAATDFIFAAFLEEWGIAGGLVVLAAYLALFFAILSVALAADRNFEKFVCIGAAIVFGWQFFLNAGSATGIVPVVGVTLPLMSYGGSSLLTSFLLLAIIYSIGRRA